MLQMLREAGSLVFILRSIRRGVTDRVDRCHIHYLNDAGHRTAISDTFETFRPYG